jgi:hypothetical protein
MWVNACIYKIICKDRKIKDFYIGSTTSKLSSRKNMHKTCYKKNDNKLYNFMKNNGGFDNFEFVIIQEYPTNNLKKLRDIENEYQLIFKPSLNSQKVQIKNYSDYYKNYHKELKEKYKEKTIKCNLCYEELDFYTYRTKRNFERHQKSFKCIKKCFENKNEEKINKLIKKFFEVYEKIPIGYGAIHKDEIIDFFGSDFEFKYIKKILFEHGIKYNYKKNYRGKFGMFEGIKNKNSKIDNNKIKCECGAIIQKYGLNQHLKKIKHLNFIKKKYLNNNELNECPLVDN